MSDPKDDSNKPTWKQILPWVGGGVAILLFLVAAFYWYAKSGDSGGVVQIQAPRLG